MSLAWRILAGIALTVGLIACSAESSSKPEAKPVVAAPLETTNVRVIGTRFGNLNTNRSVTASISAATDSIIVAEATGRVLSIRKRVGQAVQAGEIILELDAENSRLALQDAQLTLESARTNLEITTKQNPEDAKQAQLRLRSSQTALAEAARLVQANLKIYGLGGISLLELQNSQSTLRSAQAEQQAATAGLARINRASSEGVRTQQITVQQARNRVTQLQADLNKSSVKAPFAGEIADVFLETGEFASTGTRVLRLIDPKSQKLVFSVPTSDANLLNVGSQLRVFANGKVLLGKVSQDARVPSDNRLVRLRGVLLPNQTALSTGSTVRLEYRLTLAKGFIIPSGALKADGQQYFVYVNKNNKAGRALVQVLAESNGLVAVQGLAATSSLIYPVPSALEPGATVRVVQP